ncbi:hypothetical protein [Gimesia sp.]|uniref:hypothetical protein n=1 Tax=Gimesia sp. TaxID=2024833 RepID=UPI0025BC4F4E|nr:hypothetical protein [Gimesia sp.]
MKRKERIYLTLFAVTAVGYLPFAHWISTTPIGTSLFLWLAIFYGIVFLLALLAIPVSLICLFFKRYRRDALLILILVLIYIPGCIYSIHLGQQVRMARMADFADRSQILVKAIESYTQDHERPPEALEQLVPDYLPAVPGTGMMAYPEYNYHTGQKARERYQENPWVLIVPTGSGGPNWDQMMYFPKQNYPKNGYGGWLEPVGDWAYVHE